MSDIIKDEFFGELKFSDNSWCKLVDAPLYNSEENLILVVQDDNKEGILDIQREAYKTYLQKKDAYFMQLTEVLSASAAESSQTIQSKTLYIDREGNMGWICYTNRDDSCNQSDESFEVKPNTVFVSADLSVTCEEE